MRFTKKGILTTNSVVSTNAVFCQPDCDEEEEEKEVRRGSVGGSRTLNRFVIGRHYRCSPGVQ